MRRLLPATILSAVLGSAAAGPLDKPECIAGAKAEGGFDISCRLVQSALLETRSIKDPMRISYIPGGIGAVAFNTIVARRPAEGNTIVAFSGGSLLNIAQHKFGRYSEKDVRWLAAIGTDYGIFAVRTSSSLKTLQDLVEALKADPNKVVFGAGGTIGSQDWMKAALLAQASGVSHKIMRYVAFEGGGDALAALQTGHVHVYSGDVAETAAQIEAGAAIRVLAVLSEKRLPGVLADVPTAREQGIDIQWPIIRGFYMGPKVSDADFKVWTETFNKLMETREFSRQLGERGLYPLSMSGPELDAYIKRSVENYRKLAAMFGLLDRKH